MGAAREMTADWQARGQGRARTDMRGALIGLAKTGWAPGLYRCGLFAGERASAYTQVDEVRFRIVEPRRVSNAIKSE